MKKTFFLIVLIAFFTAPQNLIARATVDVNKICDEQLKASKAASIVDSLPNETAKYLKDIGAKTVKWEDLINIKCEDVLQKIFNIAKKKTPAIFKSVSFTLATILLNALFSSLENSFNNNSLNVVMGTVSNLCISMSLVKPICKIIENASFVMSSVSKLLACYLPIMGSIMVASGQNISAFSYSSIMLLLGNLASQAANNLLVPFLNCFLVLSLSTSLSTKLNLKSLNSWFFKTIKWILSFLVSVFVGVLTIKNVICSASDSFNSKTIKFLLSGCIPIIGSSLSDAFSTVHGCVKLLKSGVGAFFILAVAFIFLPIILECAIWIMSINLCAAAGEVFGVDRVGKILKSVTDVLKILLAVVVCLLFILIISTVIVLSGGSGT